MDLRPETFPQIAVITEYYCVMHMLLQQWAADSTGHWFKCNLTLCIWPDVDK